MPAPPARPWLPLAAGLLAAAASAWAGEGGASPASADCRRALDVLEAQESRLIAARAGRGAASTAAATAAAAVASSAPTVDELKSLRVAAARACLGGTGQAPPATARLIPPAAMARPAPLVPIAPIAPTSPNAPIPAGRPPPMPAQVAPPSSPLPPPPPVERPVVITHCDPAGCWGNDGTWRPRVGATLGGPRGLCTTQGALVSCP
jgi:hypothetical protein